MGIRVGVIGLGGVADRIHLPACKEVPAIELVGGADPNPDSRAKMTAKFGLPRTYATYEELLDKEKPEAVIVGTPPQLHFAICRDAMQAGAHVFCEKPFMHTIEEADRIVDIARSANRLLRVNNQYRYMSYYAETKRRLDAGEFGRPFFIQCWQQMYHPPAKETNWRNQLKQYLLFEFGTHALDLACFFFDSLPEAISVHTPRVRPEFDADILVQSTMRFPDERLAAFAFNRVSHAPEKYLEMRIDCERASVRISLGGVMKLSVDWARQLGRPVLQYGLVRGGMAWSEVNGKPSVYWKAKKGEFATATARHLEHFLTEMKQDPRPVDGAIHGREVLNLVFRGYESADAGGELVRLQRRTAPARV